MTRRKKKIEPATEVTEQTGPELEEGEILPETPTPEAEARATSPKAETLVNGKTDQPVAEDGNQPDEPEKLDPGDALTLIEDLREQYLRARADVDNIRKRAEIDVANARKFALEGFARELLNVKDSLELARAVDIESAGGGNKVIVKVVEGIDLTIKLLEAAFSRFAIEEVNPELGDKLDPERHQAMSMEETAEMEPNRICRVIQKGYLLHNRLLRPAMVMVAKQPTDT